MVRKFEIAIAGCGIGGMAAAALLSRLGHRITIFEQFSKPKPLGSGFILQPTGQAVLRELGVLDPLIDAGAPLSRLVGHALPDGRTVLDVRYETLPGTQLGLSLHRNAVFEVLFDAIHGEAIDLESDCPIVGHEFSGEQNVLIDAHGRRFGPFDICIDALGARSVLRAQRGSAFRELKFGAVWTNIETTPEELSANKLMPDALQQRYHEASRMIGLMPIGRESANAKSFKTALFWSLPGDHWSNLRENGLDAWKSEIETLWPELAFLLARIKDVEELILARYLHTSFATPAKGSLVAIGDAAHATSPQLGQGANMALLDAFALYRSFETRGDIADALSEYVRLRRIHRWFYQWASAAFTPLYQSDNTLLPALRDKILSRLATIPPAPRILAHLVAGDLIPPLLYEKLGPR